MKFDEIWQQLERKNADLKNDEAEVVFKAKNLRHLLRQVYDQGEKEAKPPTREEFKRAEREATRSAFDQFGSMFGGG